MLNEALARNVVVVGAGTMGSGIAAHLANLGFNVSLLDATQERVIDSFERARNARPPHFYVTERANDVRLGNISEHLGWIAQAGWVIEAIVERADAKKALYAQIEPYLAPDAVITTNTSGLPISELASERSESFQRRFMGTHFFNPPRYLKLLELIPTAETDPGLVQQMVRFLEDQVARRVVIAKDTPGFIANRYGMWCMFHAIHIAEKLQLSVEETDAITGPFLGRPKSATFRLNDLVGFDVMRDIANSLRERCPDDPHMVALTDPKSLFYLVSHGWTGDKVGQGYYRRQGKESLVFDFTTNAYREPRPVTFRSLEELKYLPLGERVSRALELRDPVGEFLRHYLIPALRYAESLKEDISHSVRDFDRVMQWGFGWEIGPFAMIDAIGKSSPPYYSGEQVLAFSGDYRTPAPEPEYRTLSDFEVLTRAENFVLRDLGDGVTSVGLNTKLGMITPAFVEEFTTLLKSSSLDRFVFTSEGRGFSVGFDLRFFLTAIQEERWTEIEHALLRLQNLGALMDTRICAAAITGGYCLGAGLELAQSCTVIVTHPDAQIGLPESRVGLIPGGRGTVLTRLFNQHNAKRLSEVALNLVHGRVAPSADMARMYGYLRNTDITCYHPDRILTRAKEAVLEAKRTPKPTWSPTVGPLVGMIDRELEVGEKKGEFSEYDVQIGNRIKQVYARATSYEDAVGRERLEFVELCRNALTTARIRHMLETGKPLRN